MRLDSNGVVSDSHPMWIRRESPACARMPSQRPATLNPRVPAPVAAPAVAEAAFSTARVPVAAAPTTKRDAKTAPARALAGGQADVETARDGGFHESSYELQSGLQITESEWPDDVTVPGGLGDR